KVEAISAIALPQPPLTLEKPLVRILPPRQFRLQLRQLLSLRVPLWVQTSVSLVGSELLNVRLGVRDKSHGRVMGVAVVTWRAWGWTAAAAKQTDEEVDDETKQPRWL